MAVEQYLPPSPLAHYDPADLLDALSTGIVVLDASCAWSTPTSPLRACSP